MRTSYKSQRKNKNTFFGKSESEIRKRIKILLYLFFLILSTYRGTKAIKEDQIFSFDTHKFSLTDEVATLILTKILLPQPGQIFQQTLS